MGMPVDKPLTYLDNAATTPPYPEVLARMHEVMMDGWGNPSSPHVVGRRAKEMLEESRATIADVLGVDADEIYFTSGSTESNNLAIRGACLAQRESPGKIITSTLEHSSVTRTVRGMRRDLDWDCRYVDAPDGCFDMEQLAEQLQDGPTSLISVMRVQNETGWIFPIPEIAQLRDELAPGVPLHCDATQAFCKMPVNPREWGVQLLTAGAHKIGGPRGIGILYVQRGLPMHTTAFGGNQERGLRSGTEPVFLAVGMAEAVRITAAHMETDMEYAASLRERAIEGLKREIPDAVVHAPEGGSPYILSVSVPGLPNAVSVKYLSGRRVCVSRAAACEENHTTVAPGTWRPKHSLALQAAGIRFARARKRCVRASSIAILLKMWIASLPCWRSAPRDARVVGIWNCVGVPTASKRLRSQAGGAACAADAAEDLVASGGAARGAEEVLALRLCALTGEFYRANAESFSQTRQSPWQGWVRLLEVVEAASGQEPLRVLDLACGNLRFERYLADALPSRMLSG